MNGSYVNGYSLASYRENRVHSQAMWYVGLLAGTVAGRKDFLIVLQLSPVSIIPLVIQTD